MKLLINDLLEYSRIMSKGNKLMPVDMELVLKNTLFNLKGAIEENNAQIAHDPLPNVIGDKNQLIQLFQNLIGNSVKFRQEETPKIHISAKYEENSGKYIFSIVDNAIGIDSEYLNRIFKIFQRLHTRDKYDGTGIGLAISKRIIERHNGKIWVESEPGEGSTFYFTLEKAN